MKKSRFSPGSLTSANSVANPTPAAKIHISLRPAVRRLVCLAGLWLLAPAALFGQSGPSLPVYSVVQSGALPPQAYSLAAALNIPTNVISQTNGEVLFVDPTNFMAVPTMPLTDPAAISNLLAQTPNKFPGIPLRFEQLDFAALTGLAVMSSNAAVSAFANALAGAGLVPQSATPVVNHTLLMAVYTNESSLVLTASNYLDTTVSYQFTLGGYPLIGPGAQVQAVFNPTGAVTRLLYSARLLTPGPTVSIISPTEASNRAAALLPNFNGPINVQLVYYAPPLPPGTASTIIPFYLCTGSTTLTNPWTGDTTTENALQQLIPATDNGTYVPSLSLMANLGLGGTSIVASATVSGGMPPYTYEWYGAVSNSAPGSAGGNFTYTPGFQVAPPQLAVNFSAARSLTVSWVDPTGLFQLESASNLDTGGWSPVTNDVATTNDVSTTTITMNPAQPVFYRTAISNQTVTVTHNVELNIIDANGIFVRRNYLLAVQVVPTPIQITVNPLLFIGWGTESPYDQDLGGPDTTSWLKAMRGSSVFGTERFYRGAFLADPTDFIDPPGGNDDAVVDTADLTFYCGHGNSTSFSFTTIAKGPATPSKWLGDGQPFHSWGNHGAEWLCLLSCDVLDTGQYFFAPSFRWGPAFDGLHMMLGFSTEAGAGCTTGPFGWGSTFEEVFVGDMANGKRPNWPMPIQDSWFDAAKSTGAGNPAVLAPIGPGGVCDAGDWWWGLGTVGPRIRATQIQGWFYLTQSD